MGWWGESAASGTAGSWMWARARSGPDPLYVNAEVRAGVRRSEFRARGDALRLLFYLVNPVRDDDTWAAPCLSYENR